HGDWWPPVVSTVATTGEGIDDLASAIEDHRRHLEEGGRYESLRRARSLRLFDDALDAELRLRVHG
ncbi:MAG: methylmalonyl Co-A mutase-associated GTPase MeaB, partial [Actinobacteria bacterium]|nr:methylmalonyl Co-A mutase-associated GTPase MeaB [Actinomycetota bacterium]NIW30048.1 methylmalonyl Co-A mutase-associated GTPase MeaB [Actinomycetota bacterium]NIX22518.1 methylmalonyl Co-A mutase-associated GTPase MeaB [Actinomycetota bacterium]